MDDEVGWVDEDEVNQLFLVLTKNMKELKLSKRTFSSGNFDDGFSGGDGSGVDFSGDSFNDNFGSGSFDGRDNSNGGFFGEDGSNSDGSNNDDKLKLENEYLTLRYKLRLKAAKAFIEYGDIPESNYEKHLRRSSILDDEDVQLKVTSYLQQHKFNTTIHNFCDYISNEILPSVGIEEKTKISKSTAI
ncbi:5819_t:CDS:2 [Funneliformis caledonium]|uniref:5819_t:CDS:1 n=1 Tax=Funneliformis caledonium TaxID=1117310 RepID=A0A9N9BEZ1_9GLOM|nr:5819_t:CDS:2 [Funneliformis caledonium]